MEISMTEKPKPTVCVPETRGQVVLERLQSTLNRACRNVPFHRQRFKELGLDPGAIETLGDLARLPFLERRHFGANYPYGLFAVPLRDIVRIHTAPGTSRHPTVSGYTRQDLGTWERVVAEALENSGVSADDILQISLDAGLDNWGRDYKAGAEALGASVIPNTLLSIDKQILVLQDYKPSVLVTTPSQAADLARHVRQAQLDPALFSLRTMILVGELADDGLRRELEACMGVNTWQHYGLSEVPGPAVGFECPDRLSLHINDEHFLAEIVDPATGVVLPDGQAGELVLTTLTTRAFPLLRFRTGDRAALLAEPCSCDCRRTRIRWFPERLDDTLVIRGVKVHPTQVDACVAEALGDLPAAYHHMASRHAGRTFLEILLAVDEAFFSDEIKVLENRARRVRQRVHMDIGVPVIVRLCEVESIRRLKAPA
jgi:phenylacetate-CoA ligase